jgi:hypothetical protein
MIGVVGIIYENESFKEMAKVVGMFSGISLAFLVGKEFYQK